MNRNFLIKVLFAAILPLFISCENKDNPSNEDINNNNGNQQQNPVELVMNVDDPEILALQVADGTSVHYYGEKNDDGTPKSIQQIFVKDNIDGNTIIDVDEKLKPTRIVTYTGVTYDIEWSSDTEGVINAYEPVSKTTVCVNFDTKTEIGILDTPKTSIKKAARNGEFRTSIVPNNTSINNNYYVQKKVRSAADGNQSVLVTFEKCDDFYDPTSIYLTVLGEDGSWRGELHQYEKIATGKYLFQIPSSKYSSIDMEQWVDAINNVFSAVGFVSECLVAVGGDYVLCAAVSAGLTALTEGAFIAAAPGFTAGCTAAIKGLAAASLINGVGLSGVPAFGADNTPTLSNAFIQMLKDANLLKKIYTDNIKIGCVVNGTAGGWPEVLMTPDDLSKVIPIVTEGTPLMQRFYLDPSSPVAYQGYNAYAVLHCMEKGTKVTMHIEGTDGYKKTQEYTITSTNSTISMYVPGAEKGVQDIVTIDIRTSTGDFLQGSHAYLWFH